MKHVFLLIVLTASSGFPQTPRNKLSPAEQKAGWVLLFDGVDKAANWHTGLTGTANTWRVEDSTLANPLTDAPVTDFSGTYEIWTKDTTFSNFEFSVEWKLSQRGNSGIFIRTDLRNRSCSSEEFAILDDSSGDDRTILGHMPGETTIPIRRTAEDYDLYPTTQGGVIGGAYIGIAKPFDQWNKGVYWANDSLIEHWLNGQKVTDYKLGSADWLQRFSLSKYYNQTCPASMSNYKQTWGRKKSGPIGMQDHGGGLRVWFRNIKVRRFTPGEKLVSPLITPGGLVFPNTGFVKATIEAAITGATIRYTIDGSDPTESSLIYSDTLTIRPITGWIVTLKARTFRAGFQTSDIATAIYNYPDPIFTVGPESPEMSFSQIGSRIFIDNKNGEPLAVDVLSVKGEKQASFLVNGGAHEFDLRKHNAGLYLVRMRNGNGWSRTLKIVLP